MDIITTQQIDTVTEQDIGSKAYRLLELSRAGFNVPPLCAVHKSVFTRHRQELTDDGNGAQSEALSDISLEPTFRALLASHLDPEKSYAVRSSAVGEDGSTYSFAGQLKSFLAARPEDVPDHIREVWASAYSAHAHGYRERHGLSQEPIQVAVAIQEMVNSEVSGVAFAVDPVSGDRCAVVIAAVYGLGEGLVSGQLDADTFTVKDGQVSTALANKTHAIVPNCRTTKRVALPPAQHRPPCMTEAQVHEVAEAVGGISAFYGKPQDIEWAIRDNRLYILQSRPITTLAQLTDRRQQHRIWDNSNIVESYSGISGPLTFSFVQDVYTHVYQQFCLIMGVERELIHANQSIFQMLGQVRGCIYYNLLNWYKVLSLLPGYSINAAFMEQMMGVTEKIDFPPLVQSTRNQYLRVAKMAGLLTINLVTLPAKTRQFFKRLDRVLQPYEGENPLRHTHRTVDSLSEEYRRLERELLEHWQAPLIASGLIPRSLLRF